MSDQYDDDRQIHPEVDPSDLRVHDFDVRDAVFVIPSDVPVPSELSDVTIPTGSLYDRLAALNVDDPKDFAFVPVSGAELLSLDRAWRALAKPRRVFALMDLPGARYDILFTQSIRQIGIQQIDWPAVSQAMADRVRHVQRTSDKSAWNLKQDLTQPTARRALKSSTERLDVKPLDVPVAEDLDEN